MRFLQHRHHRISVCLVVGLALLPIGAAADSTEAQLQVLQAQEAAEKATLATLGGQQRTLEQSLQQLRNDLSQRQSSLSELQAQAAQVDAEIRATEGEEQRVADAHERRMRSYGAQVREIYKSGPGGSWTYVFAAPSFSDFLDRAISFVRVARFQRDQAARLADEQAQLLADRRRTAALRASLEPLLAQLASATDQAAASVGTALAEVSQLELGQRQALAAIQGTQQRQKQLESALAAQEAAAQAAAQKAAQAANRPGGSGGGATYGAVCPAAPSGKISFCGHGWGHGVGLAQYGALGMAQAGNGWQAIVTHFYTGANPASTPDQTMRVWLRRATAAVTVLNAPGVAEDTSGRSLGVIPPGTQVSLSAQSDGSVIGKWSGGQARARPLRIVPGAGGLFSTAGTRYRGEAWVDGSSGLRVIDHVDLEEYLQGLGEVPTSWPLAAIEAQTVAARTFALYHLGNSGTYDVDDTTAYQVYGGVDREASTQTQAVQSTRGIAIFYSGSLIDAVFSSSDGGHSQCASAEWGSGDNPCTPAYLRGVVDNYDVSPLHTWYTPAYTLAQVQQYLGSTYSSANCGTLTGFDLGNRDASNRLSSVKLLGTRGVCTVTPGAFIRAFNAGSPPDAIIYGDLMGTTPGNHAWPYW
ncbi:MAG: SpoIID/LytB domain-containing protein [Candidatus Dormibacteria bacterium]